ncbi:MAG: T9SS type A sorting domain-containing protein [Chitinophagaceae bacterium]|nr:T9SS type A sorting domain-containing protein [Chitinophagaceae bacterium]
MGKSAVPNAAQGHFYYLPNGTTNTGSINIYGATYNGGTINVIGNVDANGAGGGSLGFVRLAMGPDGRGWILAGDGSNVYLSKFTPGANPTANSATTSTEDVDGVTLVGGSAATFQNGDICLSGNGTIFALANNGSGVTQIFRGTPNGNSTILTKVFDLVDNTGAPFSGRVNGVAFDLLGSLYISTDLGLFFIDQNTVNGPAGTVACILVQSQPGLQDLASNVWPTQSTLPVKLGTFNVTKQGNNAVIDWTTLTEINSDYFEIERSKDGINFVSAGTKQAAGNSAAAVNYQFIDPITINSGILYYRLKSVDLDAKSTYSKIVTLRLSASIVKDFNVYPNPFSSDLKVELKSTKETTITIRISNAAGQLVVSRKAVLQTGDNTVVLSSELSTLKSGMYMMEVVTEEGKLTQKIIRR